MPYCVSVCPHTVDVVKLRRVCFACFTDTVRLFPVLGPESHVVQPAPFVPKHAPRTAPAGEHRKQPSKTEREEEGGSGEEEERQEAEEKDEKEEEVEGQERECGEEAETGEENKKGPADRQRELREELLELQLQVGITRSTP